MTLGDIKMAHSASSHSTVKYCCLDKGCASISRTGERTASKAGMLYYIVSIVPKMKSISPAVGLQVEKNMQQITQRVRL